MCGICGWVGPVGSETPQHVDKMLRAMHKRGPDAEGLWRAADGRAVLGHTRLSIIDVGGSHQPMFNEDGSVVVIYNGETYNFQGLRCDLQRRGHVLRTQGDTEVLVHLYEECGPAMVEQLDGMFAFALYDASKQLLLLARDRIGIKPLHYWHDPQSGELVFASDVGAILAHPAAPRQINRRALAQYLHFGYVINPETMIRGLAQLEPGEVLIWQSGRIARTKYYCWSYQPRSDLRDRQAAIEALQETLRASVASHLVSDAPLGSFLSGGVDSTVVSGLAQQTRSSEDPVASFNVAFWTADYDESKRAEAIARDIGTQHTIITAKRMAFSRDIMERLVVGLGAPLADPSILSVYLLCEQARPYVKVALSGDGGDELFFGYNDFAKQRLARRFRAMPPDLRRLGERAFAGTQSTVPRRLNRTLRLSLCDDPGLLIEWYRRWDWPDLQAVLGDQLFCELFDLGSDLFPEVRVCIGDGEVGGFMEQQLRFFLNVVLPNGFLYKVDRMSMANSLEVRVPILSNRMLDFAGQLPLDMRTWRGRTKEPLRTIAERLSPTLAQPFSKHGFGFPIELWMGESFVAGWREWGLTRILSGIGFQAAALDRLVDRYAQLVHHQAGYEISSLSTRLFDLMVLALWLDIYQVTA